MKEFEVTLDVTFGTTLYIKAENAKEAEEKAKKSIATKSDLGQSYWLVGVDAVDICDN